MIVSDYNAVQQCSSSFKSALVSCVNAGVDMIMTAGGLIGFAKDVLWREQIKLFEEVVVGTPRRLEPGGQPNSRGLDHWTPVAQVDSFRCRG